MDCATSFRRNQPTLPEVMVCLDEQSARRQAMKKLTVIRMESGLEQVGKQPADHPDAACRYQFAKFDRSIDDLTVQEPTQSPHACSNHRVLFRIRHSRSLPLPPCRDRASPAERALAFCAVKRNP